MDSDGEESFVVCSRCGRQRSCPPEGSPEDAFECSAHHETRFASCDSGLELRVALRVLFDKAERTLVFVKPSGADNDVWAASSDGSTSGDTFDNALRLTARHFCLYLKVQVMAFLLSDLLSDLCSDFTADKLTNTLKQFDHPLIDWLVDCEAVAESPGGVSRLAPIPATAYSAAAAAAAEEDNSSGDPETEQRHADLMSAVTRAISLQVVPLSAGADKAGSKCLAKDASKGGCLHAVGLPSFNTLIVLVVGQLKREGVVAATGVRYRVAPAALHWLELQLHGDILESTAPVLPDAVPPHAVWPPVNQNTLLLLPESAGWHPPHAMATQSQLSVAPAVALGGGESQGGGGGVGSGRTRRIKQGGGGGTNKRGGDEDSASAVALLKASHGKLPGRRVTNAAGKQAKPSGGGSAAGGKSAVKRKNGSVIKMKFASAPLHPSAAGRAPVVVPADLVLPAYHMPMTADTATQTLKIAGGGGGEWNEGGAVIQTQFEAAQSIGVSAASMGRLAEAQRRVFGQVGDDVLGSMVQQSDAHGKAVSGESALVATVCALLDCLEKEVSWSTLRVLQQNMADERISIVKRAMAYVSSPATVP